MSYHNPSYLFVFLPMVLLSYQLMPRRLRPFMLLLASGIFYWKLSHGLILYMIGTSLFTHYICIWMTFCRSLQKKKTQIRAILLFGVLCILGVLLYMKYSAFFAGNYNMIAKRAGFPLLEIGKLILPLGISFYSLQAIGLMVDVYWDKVKIDLHPGRTMLFLFFFPCIVEGPILAYEQVGETLNSGEPIRLSNLSRGCVRILWGLFKKLIIADRLNVVVNEIFTNNARYTGTLYAVGAVFYTIQLYMEFSGVMDIVVGSGKMFGITLPENFRQPFFAVNASDFWRRWHISLGSWFRKYVFYPVSVSGPVKAWGRLSGKRYGKMVRKLGTLAMALFPVWFFNGLWHGPRWSYIFYGMYYFTIILLTEALDPLRLSILKRLHIPEKNPFYRGFRILRNWCVIFIGELFFRAESLRKGMRMFLKIFQEFSLSDLNAKVMLQFGLDQADYIAIVVGCLIVFVVGLIKEMKLFGEEGIYGLALPIRWVVYYGLIFAVVLMGAYGTGYQPVDLIYAGF